MQWFRRTSNANNANAHYLLSGIDIGNNELILTGTYNPNPTDTDIENELVIINSNLDGKNSCCLITAEAQYKAYELCSRDIVLKDKVIRLEIKSVSNSIEIPEPIEICDDKKSSDGVFDSKFSNVEVFPNPSSGMFSIVLNSDVEFIRNINMFSLDGTLILSDDIENGNKLKSNSFNLSDFSDGVYILKIESNRKYVYRKRITIIK